MKRARCTWNTMAKHGNFEFQKNNYEELRITLNKKVFRTFHSQKAYTDAKNYWKIIIETMH